MIVQILFLLVFKTCNIIFFQILLIFQLRFLSINLTDIIILIAENHRELLNGLSSLIIFFRILKSVGIHLWFFSEFNPFIHSHSKWLKLHHGRSFYVLVWRSLFLTVLKLKISFWILSHSSNKSFRLIFIWLIWMKARRVKSFNQSFHFLFNNSLLPQLILIHIRLLHHLPKMIFWDLTSCLESWIFRLNLAHLTLKSLALNIAYLALYFYLLLLLLFHFCTIFILIVKIYFN